MIFRRAKKKLSVTQERLCLQTDPIRRVFSLVLFILLLIAFLLNVDFNRDFYNEQLPGTILFIVIMSISFYLTIYCWKLYYKQGDTILHIQIYLLFFRISNREIKVCELVELCAEHAVLVRKNKSFKKRNNLPGLFGKKNYELVYLYLICSNRKVLLDSSFHAGQIRTTGSTIAEYIHLPYRDVDIENNHGI